MPMPLIGAPPPPVMNQDPLPPAWSTTDQPANPDSKPPVEIRSAHAGAAQKASAASPPRMNFFMACPFPLPGHLSALHNRRVPVMIRLLPKCTPVFNAETQINRTKAFGIHCKMSQS